MSAPRQQLPEEHPVQTDQVGTAMRAIYNWSYEPELDSLRTLYANALERQWIAVRDLDWERGVDKEAFSETFSLGGLPVSKTRFWQTLAPDTRWEVARRSACFLLSNFLHGEQGALMVAGQLVERGVAWQSIVLGTAIAVLPLAALLAATELPSGRHHRVRSAGAPRITLAPKGGMKLVFQRA